MSNTDRGDRREENSSRIKKAVAEDPLSGFGPGSRTPLDLASSRTLTMHGMRERAPGVDRAIVMTPKEGIFLVHGSNAPLSSQARMVYGPELRNQRGTLPIHIVPSGSVVIARTGLVEIVATLVVSLRDTEEFSTRVENVAVERKTRDGEQTEVELVAEVATDTVFAIAPQRENAEHRDPLSSVELVLGLNGRDWIRTPLLANYGIIQIPAQLSRGDEISVYVNVNGATRHGTASLSVSSIALESR